MGGEEQHGKGRDGPAPREGHAGGSDVARTAAGVAIDEVAIDIVERLARDWRERVADDASIDTPGHDEAEVSLVGEVLTRLLYVPDTSVSVSERGVVLARRIGHGAGESGGSVAALLGRFAHLRASLFRHALERAVPAAPGIEHTERALAAIDAMLAPLLAAAVDGWQQGGGRDTRLERLVRCLRHDIKTPLQAASLNLELLALESVGSDVDVAAIETIQQSIDQAVEMLQPLDRVDERAD